MTATPLLTLTQLLRQSCNQYGSRPALGMAFTTPLTYKELFQQVTALAALLAHKGLKKGDRVAILAENSPQWGICYFATQFCGAVAVPILPDFPDTDVRHILSETKAKILFTTQRQLSKIYEIQSSSLQNIISLDDVLDHDCPIQQETFSSWQKQAVKISPKKIQKKSLATRPDDLASIIYTSGTSGHSKAVMLSHKNLCTNTSSAAILIPFLKKEWTFLSILPMSHTYEFTIGFLLPIFTGCRIVYAGKPPTPSILQRICATEKPHIICIVPMVMEKIYKKRVLATLEQKKLLKKLCRLSFIRKRVMTTVGKKLLAFFGGHLQLLAIGGAALNHETEHFLRQAQIPYVIGYGLTESSPLLAAGPLFSTDIPLGSTGKPIPGVKIRIADPNPSSGIGEIMAQGDNIMRGYFNDKKATKETLSSDNWLDTGDLGRIDSQGFVHIKGRSKSVIVLSSGENVYPEGIEDKINSYECVAESLVGENNNKLEARVYLDQDVIDRNVGNADQSAQQVWVSKKLKEMQIAINSQLPPYAKLSRFVEQKDPFTKTATHKIKRYLYAKTD